MVGLTDPQANTGETLVDLNGTVLAPSDHGLDSEGLVAMPDGTFWVSDEYGPFIVHFDANGKELERLSPFDGTLPTELSLRSPNQVMQAVMEADVAAPIGHGQCPPFSDHLRGSTTPRASGGRWRPFSADRVEQQRRGHRRPVGADCAGHGARSCARLGSQGLLERG